MITDALLRLCNNLDIGNLGNDATVLTDVVDLGAARDVGQGHPLYVHFTVTETFAGLTSLEAQIVIDSDAGFTTGGGNPAPVVIASTGAIATFRLRLLFKSRRRSGLRASGILLSSLFVLATRPPELLRPTSSWMSKTARSSTLLGLP